MVSRHPLRVKNKVAIRALKKKKANPEDCIQKTAYRMLPYFTKTKNQTMLKIMLFRNIYARKNFPRMGVLYG